jgi:uncharacterized surface protein with fasciclin (FAS1) repeats
LLGAVLLFVGVAGCTAEAPEAASDAPSLQSASVPDSMTIPRMLETDGRFSTLRAALDSTGLDSLLATRGPYTLFAPPNEAFDALPPGTMDALLTEQRDRLRTILAQHVVEGRLSTTDAALPQQLVTLSGDTLSLRRTQDGIAVNEIALIDDNIETANGLLHVLDAVLPPPPSLENP